MLFFQPSDFIPPLDFVSWTKELSASTSYEKKLKFRGLEEKHNLGVEGWVEFRWGEVRHEHEQYERRQKRMGILL